MRRGYRIFFVNRCLLLDDSNGASVATLTLMTGLASFGLEVEGLCGTLVDAGDVGRAPAEVLAERGFPCERQGGSAWTVAADAVYAADPPRLRTVVQGVPLTIHDRPICLYHDPRPDEVREFLGLFDQAIARFRPDVLVTYGGDRLTRAIMARARSRGIATVFHLHNFFYHGRDNFAEADAVLVPSRFAADHYREKLGLDCATLPYVVDADRVRVDHPEPTYLTMVNPSPEKGVYPFVRIADELGRRRPDIPILVVESRGSERTLVDCGIDLRPHGNVSLMARTPDPRRFWRVTKLVLMPSLFLESQGMVAVEAMTNGIPVIASDRGALPETLGVAGLILPLPGHLTPFSRHLPSVAEVEPWLAAIERIWDDRDGYEAHRGRCLAESKRWSVGVLLPRYVDFFRNTRTCRPESAGNFNLSG